MASLVEFSGNNPIYYRKNISLGGMNMKEYFLVKEVIDEWDPIGLLGMGCPDDEYDPEIKDIVKRLSNSNSVDVLTKEIQEVFIKWFGEHLSTRDCLSAAQKILVRMS
ncbi:DUF1871 family protein [Neobacillus sp. SCS-31]|uniref:DUF1871 family protein n=1 Tax=Neobacillus oceani TaxID=3115292 RepID=UPI003906122E